MDTLKRKKSSSRKPKQPSKEDITYLLNNATAAELEHLNFASDELSYGTRTRRLLAKIKRRL